MQVFNISEIAPLRGLTSPSRISYWDPENNTAVFSISLDGSSGTIGLINASLGTLGVFSTAGLNFEVAPVAGYILQLIASDPFNSSIFSTGSVTVRVLDAPMPPIVPTGQIVMTTPTVTATGYANNQPLSPPVQATLQDNPNGTYASPLTYSLLSFATGAAQSLCAINASLEIPTTTGVAAAQSLFSIASTTGVISVAAQSVNPTRGPWGSRPVFPFAGEKKPVVALVYVELENISCSCTCTCLCMLGNSETRIRIRVRISIFMIPVEPLVVHMIVDLERYKYTHCVH